MSTLHLIHPDNRPFVDFPVFDPDRDELATFRKEMLQRFAAMAPPDAIEVDERLVPGSAGASVVRVLLYRPARGQPGGPAILYIHGGGFFTGTPDMMNTASQALADKTGALVVSVDYRLAPETPFPGPVEDCYAALAWVHDMADQLAIDSSRITVFGESAGGGLAAATAQLVRDRGRYALKAQ